MSITYIAAVPAKILLEFYLLQPWENLSLSCIEFTNIGYKIRKDFVPCLWFQQQVVSFKTSSCQKITLAPTRFKMKVIVSISTDMQSFSVGSYKKVCLNFYLEVSQDGTMLRAVFLYFHNIDEFNIKSRIER